MRAHRQRQHLERFLESAFVLEEVRVSHQTQTQRGERLERAGDRVRDPVQVRPLGRVRRQFPEMATHGIELPEQALARAPIFVAFQ